MVTQRILDTKSLNSMKLGELAMISKLRRRLANARRLRLLRKLIAEAPSATVRWDLLTIAARDAHTSP